MTYVLKTAEIISNIFLTAVLGLLAFVAFLAWDVCSHDVSCAVKVADAKLHQLITVYNDSK
jgi:hypothetical protein